MRMADSRRVKYLDHDVPSSGAARRNALQKLYEKTRISQHKMWCVMLVYRMELLMES